MPGEYQADLAARLKWTPFEDGAIASALTVTSPGALAMRIGLYANLATGGEIRFFGEHSDGDFLVMTEADAAGRSDQPEIRWSPVVKGDTIGVEIVLPSREALSTFSLRVGKISHIYASPASSRYRPQLDCSNHVDVQCRTSDFPISLESAVARIVFEKDDGSYVCSGTLMNDNADGFIPYFLTAHHCISTAVVARSVEARWFYQNAACNSGRIDSRYEITRGGADLLAASRSQDSTLLRLKESPPGGIYYSGWSARPLSHPADVYGIHHPDGGVKKYSAGETTRVQDAIVCDDPLLGVGCNTVENSIEVDWDEGTTEGGSSGSGLFDGEYMIGVLSGSGGCHSGSAYGPFRDFYPQVERWLNCDDPPCDDHGGLDDHGDTRGTATVVSLPSSTAGNIDYAADVDYFRIDLTRPIALEIHSTGDLDLIGELQNEEGETLLGDDDSGNFLNFLIATETLLLPGTYYLMVRRYASSYFPDPETGPYTLEVSVVDSRPNQILPLVTAASNAGQQGVVRIINRSDHASTVDLHAIDDTGRRFGPVSLSLGANATRHFNSEDLERGNPSKGMSGGVGDGSGNWRLELVTDLDIDARAYIRTTDGFVTSVYQVVPETETDDASTSYHVSFFNPASNRNQQSWLRLINPGDADAEVLIDGLDDRGEPPPGGEVSLTLPAGEARLLTAQELEQGGDGFSGRFGDGTGKWQLFVSADHPIQVMSLLQSPAGHLTNLSR